MKQRQVIKIDDKEITIKELTIKELLYLCHRTGWAPDVSDISKEEQFAKFKDMELYDVALLFISDIPKMEILSLAPSELKQIYDVFLQVNEVTLSVAEYMGLNKVFVDLKENLTKYFMADYGKLLSSKKDSV